MRNSNKNLKVKSKKVKPQRKIETVEKGSFSTVSSRGETIVSTRDLVGQHEGIGCYRVFQWSQIQNFKFLVVVFTFAFLLFSFCDAYATANGRAPEAKGKPQWQYIIIHHSATKRGNARLFERYHRGRGMENGLAYHFVVDNGTCDRHDGQLEIGFRWKRQLPGGHCRQQFVNEVGIGICLVGNFNKTRPTRNQMRTLINLVRELMKKYNIPIENIVGHGRIKGEKSQCPGKYFPWSDFFSQLKTAE